MLSFVMRRLGQSVIVILVASGIAFVMFQYIGDPVQSMLGPESSNTERAELRQSLGLDDPIYIQYSNFVSRAAQGEFGVSYRTQQSVSAVIWDRLQATMELAFAAGILSLAIAIPAGVMMARHFKNPISRTVQVVSIVGISLPQFVTGIVLILIFSVWLRWLPAFGRGEVVDLGWWATGYLTKSGLQSLVMPAITLALYPTALIMRLVRSEMIQILRADYVRFARARGLSNAIIYYKHALKNAMLPVVAIIGLEFGNLIAFGIIVETVFSWPGIGWLFIEALQTSDIPIITGYLLVISVLFISINLSVDLVQYFLDPRLRSKLLN